MKKMEGVRGGREPRTEVARMEKSWGDRGWM